MDVLIRRVQSRLELTPRHGNFWAEALTMPNWTGFASTLGSCEEKIVRSQMGAECRILTTAPHSFPFLGFPKCVLLGHMKPNMMVWMVCEFVVRKTALSAD